MSSANSLASRIPRRGISTAVTRITSIFHGMNSLSRSSQNRPIRLLLSDAVTDINTYICHALVQRIGKSSLRVLFDKFGVTYEEIDLGCENTQSAPSLPYETAVYSCDRFELLKQYLNQPPLSILDLRFNPTIELSLSLSVPQIEFHIQHRGGFISEDYRHFIPLQISHRLMTII